MQTSRPDTEAVDGNQTAEEKKASQMERGRRQTEMVVSEVKSGPVLSVKQMAVIICRRREREKQNETSECLSLNVSPTHTADVLDCVKKWPLNGTNLLKCLVFQRALKIGCLKCKSKLVKGHLCYFFANCGFPFKMKN